MRHYYNSTSLHQYVNQTRLALIHLEAEDTLCVRLSVFILVRAPTFAYIFLGVFQDSLSRIRGHRYSTSELTVSGHPVAFRQIFGQNLLKIR